MSRQAGVVGQQVTHRNAVGRDRVVQPEFRKIVANRLGPVETPLVDQHREARGRERLGDRANCKLGLRCRSQPCFDVALTPGFEKDGLAVLHDGHRNTGHLPLRHRLCGEGVEFPGQAGQGRILHRMLDGHSELAQDFAA